MAGIPDMRAVMTSFPFTVDVEASVVAAQEMMERHGISGGVTRVNLFRLITDFVFEHLGPDAEEKPRTTA